MTEATNRKPRSRERRTPANSPITWPVGDFSASIESGWYVLRAKDNSSILRTDCEENFMEYCRLIEQRG